MWRKSEDSKLKSSAGASPSPDPSAQHAGAAALSNSSSSPAGVSQGIKVKGEISGEGNLVFDGEFEGSITLADGTFTVGPNARVTAEIEAREIIVRGEVIGSLKARERVHIWSTGKLTGNLDSRGIMIDDGAELHSKVAVPRVAHEAAVPPAAAAEVAPTQATVAQSAAGPKVATPEIDQTPQPASVAPSLRSKGAAAGSAAQPDPKEA